MSKSSSRSASADAGATASGSLLEGYLAFSVLLPRCLLGERYFIATDEADALKQYKVLGGITSTPEIPIVKRLDEGSDAYAKALSDYEAAIVKAKTAEAVSP